MLNFKNLTAMHEFAREHRGWQGHALRFHAWRWETSVYNFYAQQGYDWSKVAIDAKAYSINLEKYLIWKDMPAKERSTKQ